MRQLVFDLIEDNDDEQVFEYSYNDVSFYSVIPRNKHDIARAKVRKEQIIFLKMTRWWKMQNLWVF